MYILKKAKQKQTFDFYDALKRCASTSFLRIRLCAPRCVKSDVHMAPNGWNLGSATPISFSVEHAIWCTTRLSKHCVRLLCHLQPRLILFGPVLRVF